jgi:hypothetical protein
MKLLLALAAAALAAAAQDNNFVLVQKEKADVEQIIANAKAISLAGGIVGPTVKGAPYSAEEIHETTQVLADGTRIHNETKTTVYRDSEGRIRRETPDEIAIWDPTTGTSFVQNRKQDIVRKQQLNVVFRTSGAGKEGEPGPVTAREGWFSSSAGPNVRVNAAQQVSGQVTAETGRVASINAAGPEGPATAAVAKPEPLGSQSIEGIVSEGARTTSTIPTGAIGNDRPINIVTERWFSPELQVVTMTRKTDPRTGEDIVRLTNISRGEQDPSLFQAPAGPWKHEPK